MLYAVLYVSVSCFVVHGYDVSRRYVCNYYVFSVVNIYLDYLKLCIMYINARMYVCYSECNVVSNECDEPAPVLYNLSVRTLVKLCIFGGFALWVSLVS